MATSLSNYWVRFFTGAGFPLDVAKKHAVVFSSNRIKPDMLPDLDKPSLKEMGITLMGDMIAILRYAKKVSEEMTCERFLVDNVDDHHDNMTQLQSAKTLAVTKMNQTKQLVKKAVPKVSTIANNKPLNTSKSDSIMEESSIKSSNTAQLAVKKKQIGNTRVVAQATNLISSQKLQPQKRKIIAQTEIIDSSESDDDKWTNQMQKRLKTTNNNDNNVINDRKNYKILLPRQQQSQQQKTQLTNQTSRSQSSSTSSPQIVNKKLLEQKRTVFDRLGDSSVTSTTNLMEPSTTFNITGLGSDVLKRNSSVFNRLGDRDVKSETIQTTNRLKNGSTNHRQQPQGILKSKVSNIGSTTSVKLMNSSIAGKISAGTMHADYERMNKKKISSSVEQLVKTTKAMKLNSNSLMVGSHARKNVPFKLASERSRIIPAKARLGLTGLQKQVTFNKIATVKHIKKPGVFSRLGV